ncbi:hypothetical protein V6615_00985 [Oscillospiraceae bacterium PP1C4]
MVKTKGSLALACYLSGNRTLLAKLDIVLFAVLCFAVWPMFKDTFMQWLFSGYAFWFESLRIR